MAERLVQDEERKVMLGRIQDRFSSLIERLVGNPSCKPFFATKKDLADYVGIKPSMLTALTVKRLMESEEYPDGITKYPTELSNTYLMPFIIKGIIMPIQLNDGKATTEKERRFWKRAHLQAAINEVESLGLDPEKELRDLALKYRDMLSKATSDKT